MLSIKMQTRGYVPRLKFLKKKLIVRVVESLFCVVMSHDFWLNEISKFSCTNECAGINLKVLIRVLKVRISHSKAKKKKIL